MAKKQPEVIIDAPEDYAAFTPPAKKDDEGISIMDAMSGLWEKQAPAKPAEAPPPPPPMIVVQAVKEELPKEGATRTFAELGTFDKKAQWIGPSPAPETVYVEMPCNICRKPMWTRRAEESVCEMCYRMEIDDQAKLRRVAYSTRGTINPLR